MPRLTPTAHTTATCHRPAWAPVATAALTAPTPKNTSTKVPTYSAIKAGPSGSGPTPARISPAGHASISVPAPFSVTVSWLSARRPAGSALR